MSIDTQILHLPNAPEDPFYSDAAPIYQTAGFHVDIDQGLDQPYFYSRIENPTRMALQRQLAVLDNACYAHASTSGLSAINTVLSLLQSGDEIIFNNCIYGGTYSLLKKIAEPKGIKIKQVDMRNIEAIKKVISPSTKLIFMESPSNPVHHICDIRAVVKLAKNNNILTAVDNSLVSSYFQKPLDLGVDFTIQSATKYLCGHGDITAGVISVASKANEEKIKTLIYGQGNALSPHDSWLLHRSIKTLGLRMRQQQQNAIAAAKYLSTQSIIPQVHYLGLESHPQHELHLSQASGFGAMISFNTPSIEFSKAFIKNAKGFFKTTSSFGSISSSLSLPATMSHYAVFGCKDAVKSFTPDLVRLSIGIEDESDIIQALDQALHHTIKDISRLI